MEATTVLVVRNKVVRTFTSAEGFEVTVSGITRDGVDLPSSSSSGLDITMATIPTGYYISHRATILF